jgi:NADP-dependent 3-hydroxy acid dehydrogenase YdfG
MIKAQGLVAWVTGAGSGIGEASALSLARLGYHVVLTGRRVAPLEFVAGKIEELGGTSAIMPGDLHQQGVAASIASRITKDFGQLDVLVNNAGTNVPNRSWDRLSEEGLDEVLGGNLHSAFLTVLAVLPVMRRQRYGIIINTASTAGRYISAQPGPAYTAAKHAVVAMSHSINVEEFQNGIRSTAICPGEVATPIVEKRPMPVDPSALSRMLQPGDVADLVAYIVSLPPRACISELVIIPTGFS